ncbi:hypothetical protein DBO93_09910 [Colwellia sp. Arc7-D]|nr:hypothetical protein DBO93_09910 [Colwellia sp. Arc7-D]
MSTSTNALLPIEQSKLANSISLPNFHVWKNFLNWPRLKSVNLTNDIKLVKSYKCSSPQKVKCNNSLVRFRVIKNYRLTLMYTISNMFYQLFNYRSDERKIIKIFQFINCSLLGAE